MKSGWKKLFLTLLQVARRKSNHLLEVVCCVSHDGLNQNTIRNKFNILNRHTKINWWIQRHVHSPISPTKILNQLLIYLPTPRKHASIFIIVSCWIILFFLDPAGWRVQIIISFLFYLADSVAMTLDAVLPKVLQHFVKNLGLTESDQYDHQKEANIKLSSLTCQFLKNQLLVQRRWSCWQLCRCERASTAQKYYCDQVWIDFETLTQH